MASGVTGECEECQREKAIGLQAKLVVGAANDPYEREADRAAAQVLAAPEARSRDLHRVTSPRISRLPYYGGTHERSAPAGVMRTLRSAGEPLPPQVRAFFEPRFGFEFGNVRVHRDAAAAASARAVAAHAYTVGNHVVFGGGQYAPHSAAGRALLAHELAHVIQQRAVVQRASVSPDLRGRHRNGPPEEDEDRQQAGPETGADSEDELDSGGIAGVLQRTPLDEFHESGWPEKNEADMIRAEDAAMRECVASTPADPAECEPARALTWADFTAAVPRSSYDAMTHSSLRERSINTALLRCTPGLPEAAGAPSRAVQASFDPARSWVKTRFANSGDPAQNGCQTNIASCQAYFDGLPANATGTWSLDTRASRSCPASARPRGDAATSRAECTSVVGRDCGDRAAAESARLLRHEQGHFDLSCAMAAKANAMLATTPDFDALLRAARTTLSRQQGLYDRQTNHGCNAARQGSWEADIAAGLPAVNIRVRAGRRGRGRGRR